MKYSMNEEHQKLKDFVPLPRKLKDDYLGGKITRNEFDVLVWIFISTNPFNGYFSVSYGGLVQDFRQGISEVNARKIISSLRKKQYIYFTNHKGRGGSFLVYPVGFQMTNKQIQNLEYLKNKELITTKPAGQTQTSATTQHNHDALNHNLEELKQRAIKGFIQKQITAPHNDNDNHNYNNIDSKKIYNNNPASFSHKEGKIIPVDGFSLKCKNWEQQKCWEIATELKETDMRFLLHCLNKYHINHIERAWGIFKEQNKKNIADPRKYFNKLIRKLAENNKDGYN